MEYMFVVVAFVRLAFGFDFGLKEDSLIVN